MKRISIICGAIVCTAAAICVASASPAKHAAAANVSSNQPPRVYVAPLVAKMELPAASTNSHSVEMGMYYLRSRLARPGRPFTCTENESDAVYRLKTVISGLRTREKSFPGETYGHATKTTIWNLDVIVSLVRNGDVVLERAKTSSYEERRPISEAQFDNNVFHNLMVAALEQAADDVVDFFEEPVSENPDSPGDEVAGGVGSMQVAATTVQAPTDVRQPIAILKPEPGVGVSDQEASQLWDFLESSVTGGEFRLVSRSDLHRMQEEIGFTTSSDLVNLSSQHRARIGRIKTVSKLLATSLGRIGGTYTLAFKVFDASTAEIETDRSRTLAAQSIDAFLPLLRSTLAEVLAAPPTGIVLAKAEVPTSMPNRVVAAFGAELLAALEAADVVIKSGEKGRYRILPRISSYTVQPVQDGDGFVYRGTLSGSLSVEGADVRPVPFGVDDVELGRAQGVAPSWLSGDYGIKLVTRVLKGMEFRQRLSSLAELTSEMKENE